MTAVLVTGMSGAGKSTALKALADHGCETINTDDGDWIEVSDSERLWREPLMTELLARERDRPLFVAGTVANQGRFADRFDAVVLLSAPPEVLLDRVGTRTTNDFGKAAPERAAIRQDIAEIEPLLRARCTHELDTTAPLDDTVAALLVIGAVDNS